MLGSLPTMVILKGVQVLRCVKDFGNDVDVLTVSLLNRSHFLMHHSICMLQTVKTKSSSRVMSRQKLLDVLSIPVIHDQIAGSDCLIMCSLALSSQSISLEDFKVSLEVRLLVLVELSFVDAHAIRIFDVGDYLRNQDFVISSIFLFVYVCLLFLEVRYIQIVSFGGSKLKLLWLLLKSGATCIVFEIAKDFCQPRWILILCTKLFQA